MPLAIFIFTLYNKEKEGNILFTTGHLTFREENGWNTYRMSIPNQEICVIFVGQILAWFQEEARKDAPTLDAFCEAFRKGDAAAIEKQFNAYPKKRSASTTPAYAK